MKFEGALTSAKDMAGHWGRYKAVEAEFVTVNGGAALGSWMGLGAPSSPLAGPSGNITVKVGDVLKGRLNISEYQVMACAEADKDPSGTAIYFTAEEDVAFVLVDRMGHCRAVGGKALCGGDYSFVTAPDRFWTMGWAMTLHDGLTNDDNVSSMGPESHGHRVGDEVEVEWGGRHPAVVLAVCSLNGSGLARFLCASTVVKNVRLQRPGECGQADWAWMVDPTKIFTGNNSPDREGDDLMRFFASSSHDKSSPWYNKYDDDYAHDADEY